MGTCARITKVAQYSSIRPPLLWALPAVPAGPRESAYTALVGPARFPFPISQIFLSASPPPATWSLRSSNTAIQISQPDFILVSRIFFIAPGPGALPLVRPLLSSSSAPTYTRAIHYKRRQQCICAKYKERRLTSEAPCSGPYLLDSLHAARFHTRSHRDIFTDRYKIPPFPLPNITYFASRLSNYLFHISLRICVNSKSLNSHRDICIIRILTIDNSNSIIIKQRHILYSRHILSP